MITPDPKPMKRLKNPAYLKFVKINHCLHCYAYAGNSHHVRWASDCGMGIKPHDYLTIAVCPKCHDLAHNDPKKFGEKVGREDVFKSMFKNITSYAENEGWDMSEIYEVLVNRLIEWIGKEKI